MIHAERILDLERSIWQDSNIWEPMKEMSQYFNIFLLFPLHPSAQSQLKMCSIFTFISYNHRSTLSRPIYKSRHFISVLSSVFKSYRTTLNWVFYCFCTQIKKNKKTNYQEILQQSSKDEVKLTRVHTVTAISSFI